MSETYSAVLAKNLNMVYETAQNSLHALKDISLEVGQGEFLSLVGPSGCGKTTFLRMVANLISPTSGTLLVNGKTPEQARLDRDYNYVFQEPALLPWRNALRNVELPLLINGVKRKEARQKAKEMLALVELTKFEDHYPMELSGGMQQRVSIARALTTDPSMLLMDEPFGSLDLFTRDRMNLELLRIWGAASRRTAIFVTHSIREAIFLSDSVAVLSPNPGRLLGVHRVKFPRPRQLNMRDSKEFREMNFAIEESIEKAILQN